MEIITNKIWIPMADNYLIVANIFRHENAKAVILVGSALGVGQYFYFGIAKYLAEQGYVVVTHDYRGVGESAPKKLRRDLDAGFVQLGKDFEQIITWASNTFEALPIYLLGHSLGSILPIFARNIGLCKSAFLVGAQTAYFKDFGNNPSQRLKTVFVWHFFVPFLTKIFGYFPGRTLNLKSENIPAKLIKDMQERRRFTEATEFLVHIGVDSQHLKLMCPVKSVTMSDDPICTEKAMRRLLVDFENAQIEQHIINAKDLGKVGHAGFFRKKHKETLWLRVDAWFDETVLAKKQELAELEIAI
jgi:predicted alpha/beta hydrolase